MARTKEEIAQAAGEAEAWLDSLDPDVTPADDVGDLRAIGLALSEIAGGEQALFAAVAIARANGRSWGEIGMVLGVSKQAARERFGAPASL